MTTHDTRKRILFAAIIAVFLVALCLFSFTNAFGAGNQADEPVPAPVEEDPVLPVEDEETSQEEDLTTADPENDEMVADENEALAEDPSLSNTAPSTDEFATTVGGITYTYSGSGRLIKKSYPNGDEVTYTYDGNGNLISQQSTSR
jgi:YD repeat-containing protein